MVFPLKVFSGFVWNSITSSSSSLANNPHSKTDTNDIKSITIQKKHDMDTMVLDMTTVIMMIKRRILA